MWRDFVSKPCPEMPRNRRQTLLGIQLGQNFTRRRLDEILMPIYVLKGYQIRFVLTTCPKSCLPPASSGLECIKWYAEESDSRNTIEATRSDPNQSDRPDRTDPTRAARSDPTRHDQTEQVTQSCDVCSNWQGQPYAYI